MGYMAIPGFLFLLWRDAHPAPLRCATDILRAPGVLDTARRLGFVARAWMCVCVCGGGGSHVYPPLLRPHRVRENDWGIVGRNNRWAWPTQSGGAPPRG